MAVQRESTGLFLKAPYVFGIQYQKGVSDQDHPSIGKIKDCALQSCVVDYTPLGSYMTFNDEKATMVSYNISLQFQEIIPIYWDEYLDNQNDSYNLYEEMFIYSHFILDHYNNNFKNALYEDSFKDPLKSNSAS